MYVKITLRHYFSPQIGKNMNTPQHILLVMCRAAGIFLYMWKCKCYDPYGGQINTVRITNVFIFWTYCSDSPATRKKWHMFMIIHCSTVCHCKRLGTTQLSVNRRLNKLCHIHTMEYYAVAKTEWMYSSLGTNMEKSSRVYPVKRGAEHHL